MMSPEESPGIARKLLVINPSDGQTIWMHEPPSVKLTNDEKAAWVENRVGLPEQVMGVPSLNYPFWLTESQVLVFDDGNIGPPQLTIHDRFNGKILQQLEVDLVNERPVTTEIGSVGGPLQGVVAGGVLVLRSGNELTIFQNETSTASHGYALGGVSPAAVGGR